MQKGIFEFEVGGVKRGFKFGMYAFGVAQEKENTTLDQLFVRCGFGNDPTRVNILSLVNLFYGAAVHYCHSKNKEVDFTATDVSDWIDELGFDETQRMMREGLTQHVPKNSKSPA
jgi:hypothetical protein